MKGREGGGDNRIKGQGVVLEARERERENERRERKRKGKE